MSSEDNTVRKPIRKAPSPIVNASPISFNKQQNIAQPNIISLRKKLESQQSIKKSGSQNSTEAANLDFLSHLREGGQAQKSRKSIEVQVVKPLPAGGRPKPAMRRVNPKARILYSYAPTDTDEIALELQEVVEVLLEGNKIYDKGIIMPIVEVLLGGNNIFDKGIIILLIVVQNYRKMALTYTKNLYG